MPLFLVFDADYKLNTSNAHTILLNKYKDNQAPEPLEIIKGDLWFTEMIDHLTKIDKIYLIDPIAKQTCFYAINRCYEIKKLLYLIYKKKTGNSYTPSALKKIPIPECNPPPTEIHQSWYENTKHRILKDTTSEMCCFLKELYKVYYPEETNEEKINSFVTNGTDNLDLLSVSIFET